MSRPPEFRRSLACNHAIENMRGTIRRVVRNVRRPRDASMALRSAGAGMMEAQPGFHRLKTTDLPRARDKLPGLNDPIGVRTSADHLEAAGRGFPASGHFRPYAMWPDPK